MQVKGLRLHGGYRRTTLSRISSKDFDELFAVVFEEDLSLREGWFIPPEVALDERHWRDRHQAWTVSLTQRLRAREGVRVMTAEELKVTSRRRLPQ